MAQETKQTQAPLLCAMGCGFYGNPRTNGMCSVCYRDFLQRQNGSGKVSDPVSECFSALGESLSTQSATVTPASALEQSSQSLITPAVEAQEEKTSAEAQDKRKTEEVAASGSDVSVQSSTTEVDKSKPKKNRCFTCRKKVGLTGFDCRCGNLFCGVHRYSDVHNCSFDYKAEAAEKIRKENPVVAGEKIKKI
ncbi:AN1-type zinc finger protein 6 [Colossoma macropomum]|uniref:AN1-type zinc finger protein 6 n=1 Tax=Colossoma macropomum TaxID=42526 RepID=UPI0018653742|nr:AN1-type zinc finger protein 6 [Colossoma macropomum]XP_036442135.1 AN1-type zinc finger protein 6 [Colossoma macropomum]XP_036442136.1 AN1-type zinc finger protein 6 [Colossoma macropomum]